MSRGKNSILDSVKNATSPIHNREKPEPHESDHPWSMVVWMVVLTFVVWGTSYFALFSGSGHLSGGDQRSASNDINSAASLISSPQMNGEKVFQTICMACHQSQGQGLPGAFPPLAGSEWALGNSKIPIKIVLKGLSGPIEVKGNTYNGAMPPFGPQLKDEEIAAALTYVRSSWGNNASEVKTSEVEAIRREIFSRTQSWTAAELKE